MADRLMEVRSQVLAAVVAERERQTLLWSGEHGWGEGDCSSDGVDPLVKLAVLSEECGEVGRALLDKDNDALRSELVQIAAVAVAWLEGME